MPRHRQQLSVAKIKTIQNTPGRYSAGHNLEFVVRGTDAGEINRRSWMFRYFDASKGYQREMGLGPFPEVSLEDARTLAEKLRMKIREAKLMGQVFNPIENKRAAQKAAMVEKAKVMTFGECADAYIKAHRDGWRNKKHAGQWQSSIDTHAKELRPLPIADVQTPHIVKCLEKIWKPKSQGGVPETAHRTKQRIKAVLEWAIDLQYRPGPNPAVFKRALPQISKIKKVNSHPALPYKVIGDFMEELRGRDGQGARALELQILTAARPGEACGARWAEIDLSEATWTIPAERMKAGVEHRIPLSDDAVDLLNKLKKGQVAEFVFPGVGGKFLTTASPMKQLHALRPGLHAHGFRSTFRTWVSESTKYPAEMGEAALAHSKDALTKAYQRGDLFEKRRRLMQDWAKACRTKAPASRGDKVVQIGSAHER